MKAIEIDVRSRAQDYRVRIERGCVEHDGLRACLDAVARDSAKDVVIVSDETVARLHLQTLERALRAAGRGVLARIIVASGEANKTLATAAHCYDALAAAGARRDTLFVALGGGMVTDLAGFVAATWLRGARWLAIPTTLLGQIDAAIGGKTGVDLPAAKNLVGAFHPPIGVLVDPAFLATLPPPELRSGLGELLKYGVLRGVPTFERIVALGAKAEAAGSDLDPLIGEAVALKADLCSRDEFDVGERRLLNLGHTIGHALETACEYRGLRHGEAVAVGMVAEAALAAEIGVGEAGTAEAIDRAREALGLRGRSERADLLFLERARAALALDKKAVGRKLVFALPRRIGDVAIVELDPAALRESIDGALLWAIAITDPA